MVPSTSLDTHGLKQPSGLHSCIKRNHLTMVELMALFSGRSDFDSVPCVCQALGHRCRCYFIRHSHSLWKGDALYHHFNSADTEIWGSQEWRHLRRKAACSLLMFLFCAHCMDNLALVWRPLFGGAACTLLCMCGGEWWGGRQPCLGVRFLAWKPFFFFFLWDLFIYLKRSMKERGQKRFPILIPQMAAEASLGWTIAGSKELQPGLLPWQGCNHWGHRLLACLVR